MEEAKEEGGGSARKEAETEEEEEAQFKARREAFKNKEQQILDMTFKKSFGGWKESDWKSFDKVYFASID